MVGESRGAGKRQRDVATRPGERQAGRVEHVELRSVVGRREGVEPQALAEGDLIQ